jgi:predicted GNAT family N-acyltransferase
MNDFELIDQFSHNQIQQLYELLQQTWWAKDRTRADVSTMLKNCMCFGVIETKTQNLVGYARVLTDELKYAFIFDVIAVEYHRGKGIGKMLMDAIIAYPKLKSIKYFELTCAPDMVAFYEKFGFSEKYDREVKPMRYAKL